jgi:hypothetical protein
MNLDIEDRHLIEEALNRGASERMLVDFFVWRGHYTTKPARTAAGESIRKMFEAPFSTTASPYSESQERVRKVLEPFFTAYRNKVLAEYGKFRERHGETFADPDGTRTPEQHYFYMRPIYYVAGFNDPLAAFLSKIRPFVFLGKNVPGGVHDALIPGLNQVPVILDQISPGLSGLVAAAIRSQDAGFVPRFIKGSSELSNHAFGLAIDIEPPSNPHIKGSLIPLLNEVAKRQSGIDFDFGSQYASGKVWSGVLSDEQRSVLVYLYGKKASRAVQDWLEENMATYEECLQEIAAGNKHNASTADRENAKQAKMAIDNERDLQLMQSLREQTGWANLNEWRQNGIQSLPFELVWALKQAFKTSPWFRWGQEYRSTKDAMHFELQAIVKHRDGSITRATLAPDANRVRPLDELFPIVFLACYTPEMDDLLDQKLIVPSPLPPRSYR